MAEQQQEGVTNIQTEQWTVGLYYSDNDVQFESRNNEDEARKIYDSRVCSKLLLYQDNEIVTCSTVWWDTEGIGVATLLQGPKATKTKDEIRKDLDEGLVPRVPPTRHVSTQMSLKLAMKVVFGRRACAHFGSAPYRHQSLCYYDVQKHPRVQKHIALTIDDTPCRFGPDGSELPRIRDLLKEHNAKATFMVIGSWCTPDHREDLVTLLQDGHEMGNHGMMDRSYEHDDKDKFGAAVDECCEVIQDLQTAACVENVGVRWFRAPHGRYTKVMAEELDARNLVNVMCDTYASCPIVQDGEFIGRHLTETCQDGSIILLHMPEKPVRQWCWTGLVGLLQGLKERDFKVVTVGELSRLAEAHIVQTIALNFVAVVCATDQAYLTRDMPNQFKEPFYLFLRLAILLEAFLFGVPILFIVESQPTAAFTVQSLLVATVCFAILFTMFVPKIHLGGTRRKTGWSQYWATQRRTAKTGRTKHSDDRRSFEENSTQRDVPGANESSVLVSLNSAKSLRSFWSGRKRESNRGESGGGFADAKPSLPDSESSSDQDAEGGENWQGDLRAVLS